MCSKKIWRVYCRESSIKLPREWGLCLGFCEPGVVNGSQGCSAIAISLQINTTLCLRFKTPCSWELGMGLEKARDHLRIQEREGIG